MNPMPDIPRLYTALAEWCACLIYVLPLRGRLRGWRFWLAAAGALAVQGAFLGLTGGLPLPFWIPCMAAAVGLMFLFLWLCGGAAPLDAGYLCVQAFVLAELAASLEWQLHCFLWPDGAQRAPGFLVLAGVYGGVFLLMGWLVRRHLTPEQRLGITGRELGSAFIIGVAVFAVSNLSFVSARTPFSGPYGAAVLNIRTLVDLGGVAILFAHLLQCGELRIRRELEAVQNVLQNQYIQYQQSRESIELINRRNTTTSRTRSPCCGRSRMPPGAGPSWTPWRRTSGSTRPRTRRAIRCWTRCSPARAFTARAIKSPSPAWPMEGCWTSWM